LFKICAVEAIHRNGSANRMSTCQKLIDYNELWRRRR